MTINTTFLPSRGGWFLRWYVSKHSYRSKSCIPPHVLWSLCRRIIASRQGRVSRTILFNGKSGNMEEEGLSTVGSHRTQINFSMPKCTRKQLGGAPVDGEEARDDARGFGCDFRNGTSSPSFDNMKANTMSVVRKNIDNFTKTLTESELVTVHPAVV